MRDLIVSVPDHCLSFYFSRTDKETNTILKKGVVFWGVLHLRTFFERLRFSYICARLKVLQLS